MLRHVLNFAYNYIGFQTIKNVHFMLWQTGCQIVISENIYNKINSSNSVYIKECEYGNKTIIKPAINAIQITNAIVYFCDFD